MLGKSKKTLHNMENYLVKKLKYFLIKILVKNETQIGSLISLLNIRYIFSFVNNCVFIHSKKIEAFLKALPVCCRRAGN